MPELSNDGNVKQLTVADRTRLDVDPSVVALLADVALEYGSTADGDWIRHPNGLQICWLNLLTVEYRTVIRLDKQWTFPKPFVAVPGLAATIRGYSSPLAEGILTVLVSDSFATPAYRGTGYTEDTTISLSLIAVGRWK